MPRPLGGGARLLAFGDVGDDNADPHLVVADVEDRVVADEPVTNLGRVTRQCALDVEIEDRLARLEDLGVQRLDLVGQRVAEHVAESPAECSSTGRPFRAARAWFTRT